MNEKIIDKNLSRIIKLKMCTNYLNDIEEIEDISIQDVNLMENKLNIDLTEITKLKNLKTISLKFFEITDDVIDAINQLKNVESIEFSMCVFNTKNRLPSNIKSIFIYNCQEFDLNILSENLNLEELQVIHSGMIDAANLKIFRNIKYLKLSYCSVISIPKLSELKSLEELYLNNIEIKYDIDISQIKNLKKISLNGSNVQNKEEYIQNLYKQNNNLIIEFKEDNLPTE